MLKKRLIGAVLTRNGIAVQSIGFKSFLPLGKAEIAVDFLNQWGIDEIFLSEIGPLRHKNGPDLSLIRRIAGKCNVPLTVAGGISTVEQMKNVIQAGADKIAISSAALSNPQLIEQAADIFGCQAVVVSVDYKSSGRIAIHSASDITNENVRDFALRAQDLGAGEIILRSIERDGSKIGFDIETANNVSNQLTVPCIAAAGAGCPEHFLKLFQETNVSAAAAGNFFNFYEHSVIRTKAYLRQAGVPVRLDTYADYSELTFDSNGRTLPKSEASLLALRFVHVEKEVI